MGSRRTGHGDEVAQFVGDVRRIVHGGGDLSAYEFAETRAQPVNTNFHRGLGHFQSERDIGLRGGGPAIEPGFEGGEKFWLVRVLLLQRIQGPRDERERPFAVEGRRVVLFSWQRQTRSIVDAITLGQLRTHRGQPGVDAERKQTVAIRWFKQARRQAGGPGSSAVQVEAAEPASDDRR